MRAFYLQAKNVLAERVALAIRSVKISFAFFVMTWKQPTPTDGKYNSNLSIMDWMIFCYIWNFVRNEDGVEEFWHGNKFFSVELKRGQCIFKILPTAESLGIGRKKVRKCIEKLSKWYTEMDIEREPYGLLLSFKNADDLFDMDIKMDNNGTSTGHQRDIKGTANKKNVKNVKNEKKNPIGKMTYLTNIPKEDMEQMIVDFKIETKSQIERKANEMVDWCKSKGRRYKNYRAALRAWLRKDYHERSKRDKKGMKMFIDGQNKR